MTHRRWLLMADPVHGLLQFDRDNPVHRVLLAVMNSYAFQRLRRVRQMGLAEFVFPGATHSRFNHSLGAAHLMAQLITKLQQHNENLACLQQTYPGTSISLECLLMLGILLHDLGHPPLSHTLEDALQLEAQGLGHDHYWLYEILECDEELQGVWQRFGMSDFPQVLRRFMGDEPGTPKHYLAELVSSQLDMDRLDYLLRDSHFLGVKYGQIEVERLLGCLDIYHCLPNGQPAVTVLEDGMPALEHYLFGRHQAYKMALHSLDKASEALLELTLLRFAKARDDGTVTGHDAPPLYKMMRDGHSLSVAEYLRMDDCYLWEVLHEWSLNSQDELLKQLARRLMRHNLLKFVDVCRVRQEGLTNKQRAQLKGELAEYYQKRGLDFTYGFTHAWVQPKALYHQKKAPIWIATENYGVKELPEVSALPVRELSGQGEKELWFVWDAKAQRFLTQRLQALK